MGTHARKSKISVAALKKKWINKSDSIDKNGTENQNNQIQHSRKVNNIYQHKRMSTFINTSGRCREFKESRIYNVNTT